MILQVAPWVDFSIWQLIAIACCFVWSGFVRAGLGFGGNALSLPFLLFVVADPLLFLPLMAVQLLVFSTWLAYGHQLKAWFGADHSKVERSNTINWAYLGSTLKLMLIPKLIGVLGLLTMPLLWLNTMIFTIVALYSLSFLTQRKLSIGGVWLDRLLLVLGAYVSGVSLLGAPLIVAVYAKHLPRHQLRDSLFALWFVLVWIKLVALYAAGVDLQWAQQLWLFPAAAVGHWMGMRFHRFIQSQDQSLFYRVLGSALLLISLAGLYQQWLSSSPS